MAFPPVAVHLHSYARWCPRPGCLNSVEYPPGGVRDITCKCGHEFCFNCSTEPHRPASCDTVKQYEWRRLTAKLCQVAAPISCCIASLLRVASPHRWNFKNSAESENVTWILANTKKCPKCARPIEKNQGCNHMTWYQHTEPTREPFIYNTSDSPAHSFPPQQARR